MSIVFKRLNDLKKVPRGWTLLGSFFQTLKSLRAGTLSLLPLVYFHHWVQCLAGRRWWVYICKEWTDRDFPGGPVVKTSRFHCRGIGMTPCWRTKILPATQCNQKKKVDRKTNEHNLQCSRLQELEPWAEGMRTAVQVSGYLAKQWVLWFGDIGGWLTLAGIPTLARIFGWTRWFSLPTQLLDPCLELTDGKYLHRSIPCRQANRVLMLILKKVLFSCRRNYFLAIFPPFLSRLFSKT